MQQPERVPPEIVSKEKDNNPQDVTARLRVCKAYRRAMSLVALTLLSSRNYQFDMNVNSVYSSNSA